MPSPYTSNPPMRRRPGRVGESAPVGRSFALGESLLECVKDGQAELPEQL